MLRFIAGFLLLFFCYHAAEYMIMQQNSIVGFLAGQGAFFLAAWLIARWQGFTGFAAWGIIFKKTALRNLGAGLLLGLLVYGLYFLTSLGLHFEEIVAVPPAAVFIQSFLLFTFGTFFSSLSEDVLTRSYLYKHFSGKISPGILLLLSSLVYVANHIYRLGDGIQVLLYLFILGVFLMLALMLTKNIWLTLGLHWSGNIIYQLTSNIFQTKFVNNGPGQLWLYIGFLLLLIPATYYTGKYLSALDNRSPHTGDPA